MTAYKNIIEQSIKNIASLVDDGVAISLGETKLTSSTPKEQTITSTSPRATILIKKKAFSTLKHTNDLQWMDKTEKMLLRATKALFAYKVTQIRTYESLTKIEDFFKEYQQVNLSLFADLLHDAQFLSVATEPTEKLTFRNSLKQFGNAISNSVKDLGYDGYKQDVLKIMQRNAFSNDNQLTTWIVDPDDVDNYSTGPGTGVIELGTFFSFSTTTNISTDPSSASIDVEDPYRILNITEEDIEIAIQEALEGAVGLFDQLITGTIIEPNEHQAGGSRIDYGTGYNAPILDTATIVSAGAELLGLGSLNGGLDMNYVRDRLRVFYMGKTIFNAGDGVHFYISGGKSVEGELRRSNPKDISEPQGYLEVDDVILEAERNLFTDKKIDLETYKKLRGFGSNNSPASAFNNSLSMYHVFGGFILNSSESWNAGSWIIKINCTDNMGWLKWSRFNIEPALQDAQGILEDPLTPFEIKKDSTGRILTGEGPQLIEENKTLLKSGLLSYDSGILNGQVATENNLLQGQYNLGGSLSGTKILQHPSGLIYRWKSGIITATAGLDVVDPLSETQVTTDSAQKYGLPVTNEGVLNNLDIANILSVLIVGQPYNVETFMDQAYAAHNINNQSSVSSLSSVAPLSGVLDLIRKQNVNFGSFRPYRMLTLSKSTIEQTASSNVIRSEVNKKITVLRDRRVKLSALVNQLGDSPVGGENSPLVRTLQSEIDSIDAGIRKQIDLAQQGGSISSSDLLTSNFNLFGQNRVLPLTGNPEFDHEVTRAMMIVGAQRKIEDVRLNRDQNLFIVSDQYDEHTDIRPYLFKLRGSDFKIFKGTFVSVFEKAKLAANFMNLEFFCNPQGHLEFRPPQWNRTPLSVLEKLFQIREERGGGEGIVPGFLTELFQTRADSFRREIHSLNVKIVLIALLLGKYPDSSLIPGLPYSGKNSLNFFGIKQNGIKDDEEKSLELSRGQETVGILGNLVDTGDQLLGDGIQLSATFGDDDDILSGDTKTLLGIFDPIFQEQVGAFNSVLNIASNAGASSANQIATPDNLNKIRNDFRKSYGLDPGAQLGAGQEFTERDFIFSAEGASNPDKESKAVGRIEKYFAKLQDAISSRDKLVTILQRNDAKQKEIEEIESILAGEFTGTDDENSDERRSQFGRFLDNAEDKLTNISNGLNKITDILSGEATKGSLFDHLIENDRRNLLGPGSGRRFILNDSDIITCTFTERPPDFCRVDVVGNAAIIGEGLQKTFDERYFWAGATDFDLWRQYGYKTQGPISLPFANSSELQCKPFSILELQLQRVKINQGSVTVTGNEFYSPGDVVYIPGKGLLYYIREVSHSFEFSSGFTTSLVLENGHPPGVYLPSPLDIIGQELTKDPITGTVLTYRNQKGDDDYRPLQPDSAIIFPPNINISSGNIATLLDHNDNQVRFTNMMTDLGTIMIGNRMILIRGFVRTETGEEMSKVRNNIKVIKELLQNPLQTTQHDSKGLGDDLIDGASGIVRGLGGGTGTTKGTVPLTLPNGIQVKPINPEKIIEQIVVLTRGGGAEDNVSMIECFNPQLLSAENNNGSAITVEAYQSSLPKGGPKQKTWLDIRDDLTQVSNIIEIGIIDVADVLETAGESNNTVEVKLS